MISLLFLWPVVLVVRASGAAAVVYHLLLALIVPSILAGNALAEKTRTSNELVA